MMIDRSLNYGRKKMFELYKLASPFSSILDLGAGAGTDLSLAKKASPEAQLYGIECYPELQKILAEKKIESFSLNIENEKLPFADESLDVVTSNQFLEHTKEIFWILHESTRVLKTNGYLVVGIPNLASFHNRILLLFGKQPTCIQTASAHVRGFTKHDFCRFLNTAWPQGYELIAYKGSNFYPLPPFLANPLAFLFPNFAVSIFLIFKKSGTYHCEFKKFPQEQKLETNYFTGDNSA